jgi:hypothetical protein
MPAERTLYRERSPWPGWANALLVGVTVMICYAVLAGWGGAPTPFPQRVAAAGIIVGCVGAATIVLEGLTVLVTESGVVLHLGYIPVVRRTIPFAEIESARAVRYHPIREFGGWGIRGRGRRKAWTARGDRAVVLRLTRGGELLVGSDHPQRLEDRIRTAMAHASERGE